MNVKNIAKKRTIYFPKPRRLGKKYKFLSKKFGQKSSFGKQKLHFSSKIKMLVNNFGEKIGQKNRKFRQKLKICSKIKIFVKNRKFSQK